MAVTVDRAVLAAGGLLAYTAGALVVLNVTAREIAAMRDELVEPLERARALSAPLFDLKSTNDALERLLRAVREQRGAPAA